MEIKHDPEKITVKIQLRTLALMVKANICILANVAKCAFALYNIEINSRISRMLTDWLIEHNTVRI